MNDDILARAKVIRAKARKYYGRSENQTKKRKYYALSLKAHDIASAENISYRDAMTRLGWVYA